MEMTALKSDSTKQSIQRQLEGESLHDFSARIIPIPRQGA